MSINSRIIFRINFTVHSVYIRNYISINFTSYLGQYRCEKHFFSPKNEMWYFNFVEVCIYSLCISILWKRHTSPCCFWVKHTKNGFFRGQMAKKKLTLKFQHNADIGNIIWRQETVSRNQFVLRANINHNFGFDSLSSFLFLVRTPNRRSRWLNNEKFTCHHLTKRPKYVCYE